VLARAEDQCSRETLMTPVGKDGKRGDQLVTVEVDVPADDPELQRFVEGWSTDGNPRASLGV